MIDIIKGLWKWIFWILILLLLFLIILAIRIFIIDKDYKLNSTSSSANSDSNRKDIYIAFNNGYNDGEDYNAFNFDETFLMYEGEQGNEKVKEVLNRLIDNSKGKFYARTSVTSVGFGNDVTITYDGNVKEYQEAIQNLKNLVDDGIYEISFNYGGLKSYVNNIVITKK